MRFLTKLRLSLQKIINSIKEFLEISIIRLYSGGVTGYMLGDLGGGGATGIQGRVPSLIFNFDNLKIHLHHWFLSLFFIFFLIIYFLSKKKNLKFLFFSFKFGFLFGLMLQGILNYSDWYRIISFHGVN